MATSGKDTYRTIVLNADRPRVLRLGYKAQRLICETARSGMLEMESDIKDFELLEKMVYFMLQDDALEHGENLALEDMIDILDRVPGGLAEIQRTVAEAIAAAKTDKDNAPKNRQAAVNRKGKAN